jgi:hypothetical protein
LPCATAIAGHPACSGFCRSPQDLPAR